MKRCFVYLLGSALVVTFAMSCNDETEPMEQQPVITDEAQENINQAAQDIQQGLQDVGQSIQDTGEATVRNWQRSVPQFQEEMAQLQQEFQSLRADVVRAGRRQSGKDQMLTNLEQSSNNMNQRLQQMENATETEWEQFKTCANQELEMWRTQYGQVQHSSATCTRGTSTGNTIISSR